MPLALIELDPERARDPATRVRQRRKRQPANNIIGKGAITAARLSPVVKEPLA